MRGGLLGAIASIAFAGLFSGHAVAQTPPWAWTLDSEPQYVTWSAGRGWPNAVAGPGHGSQFYVPFGVSGGGDIAQNWNLQLVTHGGYVQASQTAGAFKGSVSTATDSTVSATATYTGFNGWQPYASLMMNLPTGKSSLVNTGTFARQDPDLVPVAVYGEGFNIGPTIGVTIPINAEFAIVINGGFTERGKYWKEGGFDPITMHTAAPVNIDPSSVWTGAASATWTHERLVLQGTASYAAETANYADSAIQYRLGPRTTISGSGTYMWDNNWTTAIDGYFVHIDKNQVPVLLAPGVLSPEALDSNNNIFRINAAQMYKTPYAAGTLTVGPVGSFMYRENNSYDPTSFSFVAAKTRYSVGGSAAYTPDAKMNISARVEHIWIHADQQTFIPTVSGDGWQAILAMTLNTP